MEDARPAGRRNPRNRHRKKAWRQTVRELRLSFRFTSIAFWCGLFGYTRQNFYKAKRADTRRQLEEEIILVLVQEVRKDLPRTGTRKLYDHIKDDAMLENIKMGRDRLNDILRDNGLLIKPKRSYTKTTITNQWRKKYPDLRIELIPTYSEQLWVSDITYIRTKQGFEYLSLITDHYSKFVVGWCSFPTLQTEGCLKALSKALAKRKYPERKLIHHSDRGVQYCSTRYTSLLIDHNIDISVTQNGSPYENPVAESMNSIFKVELGLDKTFESRADARRAIAKAVRLYNEKRKHGSINYMTPTQAYDQEGHIPKRW